MSNKQKIIIAAGLIAFAVISRFLPHPPNFAPIAAIALFGGAVLPRKYAIALPLGAMVVSDLVIGLHSLVLFTWGSFVLIGWLSSRYLAGKVSALRVAGGSVGASIMFFLITNFGVWLEGLLYPRTLSGLVDAYVMAIPFFRNTLLGDMFYTGAIFGLYALGIYAGKHLALHRQSVQA